MRYRRPSSTHPALLLFAMLTLLNCSGGTADPTNDPLLDPVLNGAWVDGIQSGPVKIYITEFTFSNGRFEWTFDGDLQQRGEYDTRDGILTVTIHNNYGSPQRTLGDYSRPYAITGHTLTWGGWQFTKH